MIRIQQVVDFNGQREGHLSEMPASANTWGQLNWRLDYLKAHLEAKLARAVASLNREAFAFTDFIDKAVTDLETPKEITEAFLSTLAERAENQAIEAIQGDGEEQIREAKERFERAKLGYMRRRFSVIKAVCDEIKLQHDYLRAEFEKGRRSGAFDQEKWEAAGDWVDIPYHGKDGEQDHNVRPNQPRAGTTRFHAYATLAVIRKGKRVTLALTVVHKGEKMDQIVKRLIGQARRLGARFKCTYWDKAFGAVKVMRYLRACRVPYVIALQQHGKNGLRRLCVGRRGRRARYTFDSKEGPYKTDVVIACHYAGRASNRRPKKRKKGVRYYAYAVYGVGGRSAQAISAAYRRRFSIESGYRQLHQVRARTRSRHTGLRLLLIGLALILVNLYVLLRASWSLVTHYGSRICRRAVTLNEVATTLLVQIQSLLGFSPEFHCRAQTWYSVNFAIY